MGFKVKTTKKQDGYLFPVCVGNQYAHFADFVTLGLKEADQLGKAELNTIRQRFELLAKAGNEEAKVDLAVALALEGKNTEALKWLRSAAGNGINRAYYPLGRLLIEHYTQREDSQTAFRSEKEEVDQLQDQKKVLNEAISSLLEAIKNDPSNAAAQYYLGKAILELKQEEDAIKAFKRYINAGAPIGHLEEVEQFLKSKNSLQQRKAALDEGRKALAEKKYQQSIESFRRAIELGEESAYFFLGRSYQESGSYVQALDAYQRAGKVEDVKQREKDYHLRLGQSLYGILAAHQPAAQGVAALRHTQQLPNIPETEKLRSRKIEQLLMQTMNFLQSLDLHPPMLKVAFHKEAERLLSEASWPDPVNLQKHHILLWDDMEKADCWVFQNGNGWSIERNSGSSDSPLPPIIGSQHLSVSQLIERLRQMARWKTVLGINNPASSIEEDEFKITLLRNKEAGNLEDNAPLDDELDLQASPSFSYDAAAGSRGMQLKVTHQSKSRPLYISCLYLGADFNITNRFLAGEEINEQLKEIWMTDNFEEIQYKTIPLIVDEKYLQAGISTIHEYIKVIISTGGPLSTDALNQDIAEVSRDHAFSDRRRPLKDWTENAARMDWCARTIRLTIERTG